MKKLLVLVMMLVPLLANAVVVEIDGISYVLTSKTKEAEVIQNANGYSGEIFIPESVEYDGEKYNVVSIGEKAFYLCSGLTAVKLPNGLLSIGNNAFSYCSGLTSITIPQSLNSIGKLAFANCNSLSSVHISDLEKWCNIEYAFISSGDTQSRFFEPYHLFLNEEEIIDLVIPDNIVTLNSHTFENCVGLKSVSFGSNVETIGSCSFMGCIGIESIKMNNSVKILGSYAFWGCTGLKNVSFGSSLETIGWGTFSECSNIASITISNSVKHIYTKAFYSCTALTSLTIGSSVSEIGELSFGSCPELKDVYCLPTQIPYMKGAVGGPCTNAFEDSYIEYATLHVPENTINDYSSKAPWNGFGKIVALKDDDPQPTGILSIANNKKGTIWFDMNGRKLSSEPTSKGIYINNGKKVIK